MVSTSKFSTVMFESKSKFGEDSTEDIISSGLSLINKYSNIR